MANLIQDFQNNCSNFLYIFIPDNAVEYFRQNGGSIILKKRENQIGYVTRAAQFSKYSYKELEKAIYDAIVDMYNKTPQEIIIDIANGKNVYSTREIRQRNNVSGCRVGVTIDSQTGLPVGANENNYTQVCDPETDLVTGVFDINSGTQISWYDENKGKFVAGATPSSNINSRNMWYNNIDWTNITLAIIALIGQLFGVKKAKNLQSYQTDGWAGITQNTAQNSTNNILPLLLLGGAIYIATKEDNGKTIKINN